MSLIIHLLLLAVPLGVVALVYLVARAEVRTLRPLAAVVGRDNVAIGARCRLAVEEARSRGFRDLGLYSDGDRGWREGVFRMLLSPERDVLLVVTCSRLMDTYDLISCLPESVWLLTTNLTGEPDLSGLDDEEQVLDVPFATVLEAHLRRLAARGVMPSLFDASEVASAMHAHQTARVERMLELGLAQWKDVNARTWRYTPSGARAQRQAFRRDMWNLGEDLRKASDFKADR